LLDSLLQENIYNYDGDLFLYELELIN